MQTRLREITINYKVIEGFKIKDPQTITDYGSGYTLSKISREDLNSVQIVLSYVVSKQKRKWRKPIQTVKDIRVHFEIDIDGENFRFNTKLEYLYYMTHAVFAYFVPIGCCFFMKTHDYVKMINRIMHTLSLFCAADGLVIDNDHPVIKNYLKNIFQYDLRIQN
jgi:hypothetical protein